MATQLMTEQLAEFALDTYHSPVDARQQSSICLSILDTVAAALGGVSTVNAASTRSAMEVLFGEGDAPLWFHGLRTNLAGAVVSNCAAASALDIDDGHRGASGHPGAAIVPSVLTSASLQSDCTGKALMSGILIGYEVALRVAAARKKNPVMSFASGRWCAYGVAAALGVMTGLDQVALANALAIAGVDSPQSLPQGTSIDMGSVKGSSPWSSLVGLAAVERARAGATGPLDILDIEGMYCREIILRELSIKWAIDETYHKPYASCRYTHPAIDCVLALREQVADNLTSPKIVVEIFPEAAKIPNDTRPETLEQAQFSIPFCVALAWLRGGAAFCPMLPEHLLDEDVLHLAEQVELIFSDRFLDCFPEKTPARVVIKKGQHTLTHTVEHPFGDVANPMDRSDIERKLKSLGKEKLDGEAIERIIVGLDALPNDGPARLLRAIE